jgi:signal transduction histidine kinase/ligand-binding sensor domain-containing protein
MFSLAVLLGCLGATGNTSLAPSQERSLSELQHTSWTAREGVPGSIQALAQTSDGYVWVGTANGLCRFDGVNVEPFEPSSGGPFPGHIVESLLAMPDGGLVIGFRNAGAAFLKDERVTTYLEPKEMEQATVRKLALGADGTIWAATFPGLYRLVGQHWQRVGEDWGYPSSRAQAVFVDRGGTLWVAGDDSIFFLPPGQHRFRPTGEHIVEVDQITQAPGGEIWIAETTHSVRQITIDQHNTSHRLPEIITGSDAILFDDAGSLWIGTVGDGIGRLRFPRQLEGHGPIQFPSATEVERFTQKDGLSADDTSAVLEDREGNIWIGTDTGLDRFRETALIPSGLPPGANDMLLIPGDHGDIWSGSLNRIVTHIDGKSIEIQEPEDGWANACGYRDQNGILWFGGPAGVGHLVNGHISRVPSPLSVRSTWVTAITGESSGTLWVSFLRDGVYRFSENAWTHFDQQQGLPDGIPTNMYTDSQGRVWLGYLQGRLASLESGKFRTFTESDGITVGDVMTIYDHGGRLWIGGAYGLEVFEGGRFRKIAMAGERFVGISGIVELSSGDLWLNGANGIIYVPASEIQHSLKDPNYQASFHLFDHLDGLLGTSVLLRVRPTAVQSTDGKIWFSVGNGLIWIDPTHTLKNVLPPPVYVKSISANGTEYPNNAAVLPVNSTNVRIDYTALSLSIPERVAFRYKLDSVDKDWQDPGTRRVAFYTNLKPGHHRFQVIASNNDGVWNETGATLQFDILPAFYQTKWFSLLCLAIAASLAWTAYRYRVQQVTSRLDMRFRERLSERTRIAGELHDTLLQSVQGLILHFQRVRNLLPANPTEAGQRLDVALERAEEAIVEGRNAIHDIRSPIRIESDLAQAITALGEELSSSNKNGDSCKLKVVIEGVAKPLASILSDEVYRIAREALRNAFNHSKAWHIEAEITYGEELFRIRIRDDGKGIDPQALDQEKPGHWGLVGMRERAKRIGGQLDVWSENKAGTEVELTVPGSIAYESFSPDKGFRLFRKETNRNQ